MSTLQRILIFAFATLTGSCALGMLSAHDFSDKTVAQLLDLLESKDRTVRVDAALYLPFPFPLPAQRLEVRRQMPFLLDVNRPDATVQ